MGNDLKTATDSTISPINWPEIHRRLERARVALDQGIALASDEKKKILKSRAESLAKEPKVEASGGQIDVIEFILAYENYAIESAFVREIYPLKEFTPLPGTPPFILGIVNVRGQIISVVDLREFFELPEKGLTDFNKIILVKDDKMEFGILADTVLGVRQIPLQKLQPSLPTLTGIRAEFLKGVSAERLIVLDAAKLLSDRRMLIQQKIES
jgi:purine-binding chemotaxis protein CheW